MQSSLSGPLNIQLKLTIPGKAHLREALLLHEEALRVNRSNSYPILSNIMSLDLSYNNISMIEVGVI